MGYAGEMSGTHERSGREDVLNPMERQKSHRLVEDVGNPMEVDRVTRLSSQGSLQGLVEDVESCRRAALGGANSVW